MKRADTSLCGSILTEALRNRDIRIALLPFTQDLYHKSEADDRVIDILGAIAREPEDGGTGDYQVRAVRYIENLTQDDGERRRVLLPVAMISPPIRASYRAARTVAPLVNTEDVKSLRELAITHLRKSEYHPVIEILGYQGDTAFLPHLEQALLSQDSSIPKMVRSAFLKARWRIQAQNPPERLLDMIRTANPGRERDWMMERALALGVPTDAVREAILVYAHSQVDAKAPAWQVQRARVIVCAQRLKILSPAEIESLPLAHPAP